MTVKTKVVKCAGGLVVCKQSVLLLYKNNSWDLPKGRIHLNESKKEAAIRETHEETGLKIQHLKIVRKLPKTHHRKKNNSKEYVKITYWYEMIYDGDMSDITPQIKEGIFGCVWFKKNQLKKLPFNRKWIDYIINFYL